MKKCLLLFAVLFTLASCSLEGDEERADFNMVFIAADSIAAPEYVVPGNTYPIKLYYKRPNNCYYVNGVYTEANGYTLTLAVQSILIENADCNSVATAQEVATYNFECPLTQSSSYDLRVYNGDTERGERKFLTVTMPVHR